MIKFLNHWAWGDYPSSFLVSAGFVSVLVLLAHLWDLASPTLTTWLQSPQMNPSDFTTIETIPLLARIA